jgi:hypothetical protein
MFQWLMTTSLQVESRGEFAERCPSPHWFPFLEPRTLTAHLLRSHMINPIDRLDQESGGWVKVLTDPGLDPDDPLAEPLFEA